MSIDESDAATQRRQRRITLTEAVIRPCYQKCDPLAAAGTTVVPQTVDWLSVMTGVELKLTAYRERSRPDWN
jgi:hypothetical protein